VDANVSEDFEDHILIAYLFNPNVEIYSWAVSFAALPKQETNFHAHKQQLK
jgi:hypothetical protein